MITTFIDYKYRLESVERIKGAETRVVKF